MNAIHNVRVTRLPNGHNMTIAYADIPFDDPPMIHNDSIRNQRVEHSLRTSRAAGLTHAVTDHLPAAELALIPINGIIMLNLCPQLGICQANGISCRRAEHQG